jgi:hypothetical protein
VRILFAAMHGSVPESAADDLARDLGTAALNPKKISALRREDNAE